MTGHGNVEDSMLITLDKLEQTAQRLLWLSKRAREEYEGYVAGDKGGEYPEANRLHLLGRQLNALVELSAKIERLVSGERSLSPDELEPAFRLVRGQEEEQARLARSLEDKTGQLLANAVYEVASCHRLIDSDVEGVKKGLLSLQGELEYGLQDLRMLVAELAPLTEIRQFGLVGGLRRYLDKLWERTGIETELHVQAADTGDTVERLPHMVKVSVFRVAQEALGQVERRADASRVEVILEDEAEKGWLTLVVKDNGGGIAPKQETYPPAGRSMGDPERNIRSLSGMYARAELLQGELGILEQENGGTRFVFSVPYFHFL